MGSKEGKSMEWIYRFVFRGRGTPLLLLVLALLLFMPAAAQPAEAGGYGAGKLTVMTRNLYLGASLDPILAAGDFTELVIAVTNTWDAVQDTDFEERARALAREIVRARPDFIGLQEAVVWRRQYPSDPTTPATKVVYDYTKILQRELWKRGMCYEVVVSQDNLDAEFPTLYGDDIRYTDRDVILARKRWGHGGPKVVASAAAHFSSDYLVKVQVAGSGGPVVTIYRGWVSADVWYCGKKFRLVNTHLEDPIAPEVELLQQATALELLKGPLNTYLPVICLGDFNADAFGGSKTYDILLAGGLVDAWTDLVDPGLTWGHAADLLNETVNFTKRIDMVFHRGPFKVRYVDIVGDELRDRTKSGLWPSDHGGVVAKLMMKPHRHWRKHRRYCLSSK
jgi:endonuclease/exonuclease/phosphatase family metal-dependent hydrolase